MTPEAWAAGGAVFYAAAFVTILGCRSWRRSDPVLWGVGLIWCVSWTAGFALAAWVGT